MPNSAVRHPGDTASLARYSSESLMLPSLAERDAAGVIQELSRRLQREGRIPDMLPFYNAALNREFLTSTAMGEALAFPHARLSGVHHLCFALGRSRFPIPWGMKGSVPVRLVFLMAVPETDSTQYLSLISGLGRLSKENALVEQLLSAPSAAEMFCALKQVVLRRVAARTPFSPLDE